MGTAASGRLSDVLMCLNCWEAADTGSSSKCWSANVIYTKDEKVVDRAVLRS